MQNITEADIKTSFTLDFLQRIIRVYSPEEGKGRLVYQWNYYVDSKDDYIEYSDGIETIRQVYRDSDLCNSLEDELQERWDLIYNKLAKIGEEIIDTLIDIVDGKSLRIKTKTEKCEPGVTNLPKSFYEYKFFISYRNMHSFEMDILKSTLKELRKDLC